jgi:hypothetical protein
MQRSGRIHESFTHLDLIPEEFKPKGGRFSTPITFQKFTLLPQDSCKMWKVTGVTHTGRQSQGLYFVGFF